jgi:signal transduction histidine kinase
MIDPTCTAPPGRFRLLRFYMLSTLLLFGAAAAAMFFLQEREEAFFAQVQREQQQAFARAQAELARRNAQAARDSLLAVHEAGHVNLTRLVANTMWQADFAPLVASAQRFPIEPCRALTGNEAARRECQGELGRRIMALPGFATLDRKAAAAMHASTVFKIKVFDLRGVTVYSSEHTQIGEDRSANQGWRSAVAGVPASELTHRERFSTFEGVVENRDLISSYVPVQARPDDRVAGVFELYSDVTPFLAQMQAAGKALADNIAANEADAARAAQDNQRTVEHNSAGFLAVVGGLVALLYLASLAVVLVGQRFIDRQSLAQEQAARREQRWHREKMAALAAMAANVSHEVGNPLAVIAGVAQALPERASSQTILDQTTRIAGMVRKIADFASASAEAKQWVDLNAMVEAVCAFQGFDRRFRGTPIRFTPDANLPAVELVPDHLNEVMMNLLQALAGIEAREGAARGIHVATGAEPGSVAIELGCHGTAGGEPLAIDRVGADARFEPARRRVAEMGGDVELSATQLRITLPAAPA